MAVWLVSAVILGWALYLRRRLAAEAQALRRVSGQVDASRVTAEAALERARAADWLEQRRKAVMDLMACDEPLANVLEEIARAVEAQCEGMCSLRLSTDGPGAAGAGPSLPPEWRRALGSLEVGSIRVGLRHRALPEFSPERQWAEFVATSQRGAVQSVFALPVLSGAERVGVISLFFAHARRVADQEVAILSSWSGLAGMAVDRQRMREQLQFQARHDELTGLPKRAVLLERLSQEIERCRQQRCVLAVLSLDLDGFRALNNELGEAAGNCVLRHAAERMRAAVRRSDTVARTGGDEFAILLPDLRDASDAAAVAQTLRQALSMPVFCESEQVVCGCSAGLSFYPADGDDPERLLRAAGTRRHEQKALRKLKKGNESAPRPAPAVPASYFIG